MYFEIYEPSTFISIKTTEELHFKFVEGVKPESLKVHLSLPNASCIHFASIIFGFPVGFQLSITLTW